MMTDDEYRIRTERRIDSLLEVIQEQQQQIDAMQPVYDYACQLAELWDQRFTTLPNNNQELVRLCRRAKGGGQCETTTTTFT